MPADVRRRWDAARRRMRCAIRQLEWDVYDADLNLIVASTPPHRSRERPTDGAKCWRRISNRELNSPNDDVCVRSDGSIYFSDPWYGRMPVMVSSGRASSVSCLSVPPGGKNRRN
jgi:gluconolactonase